ncbi:MAG: 30S ribosomal protein S16 [Mariprofundaceae bacterium]
MATVIRLQRGGRKKQPFYSIVVMDSRDRRDGAFIEKLGYFDPCKQPEVIKLDQDRARHWIGQGATPSDRVSSLLKAVEQGSTYAQKAERKAGRKAAAKDSAGPSEEIVETSPEAKVEVAAAEGSVSTEKTADTDGKEAAT